MMILYPYFKEKISLTSHFLHDCNVHGVRGDVTFYSHVRKSKNHELKQNI